MSDERYPAPMRVFDLAVQGVVGGLILLVGMLLTPPRSRWTEAALIVGLGIVVSGTTAILVNRSYLVFMQRVIAERLAHITKAALVHGAGVGELVTKEVLSALEGSMDVETIWIVCQDFGDDVDPPFVDVIRHNVLARGISYVYITPDGVDPPYQLDQLRQAVGIDEADPALVTCIQLPDEQWSRLPYTAGNVTIYDPVASKNPSGYRIPRGVFWYPGGDGESFGWLGDDVVKRWAAQIAKVCSSTSGGPGAGPPMQRPHLSGSPPLVEGSAVDETTA